MTSQRSADLDRRPFTRPMALVCAGISTLAGLVYLNALHNPFVYDDHRMIVENASLRTLSNLNAIVWHDISRPLVNITYAVDFAIWGANPFGFHLTNVLLHMLNVVLVFVLVRRISIDAAWQRASELSIAYRVRPDLVAAAASVLLAVHPMMTEATGYVSGRPEVLCATLLLVAFMSGRRWLLTGERMAAVTTLAVWVLADTAKESATMFPVVLLCYDYFVLPGGAAEKRRRFAWTHLPLMALAAAGAIARIALLARVEPGGITVHLTYGLVELDVLRQYLLLFLVPHGQAIFHSVPPVAGLLTARALLSISTLGLLVLLVWRLRKADGVAALGAFWFLALLVPATVLVMLDLGEPMAEHRVYVASVGVFMIAGSAVGWAWAYLETVSRRARVIALVDAALVLTMLTGSTLIRNAVWSNPITLWLEAAKQAPDQWVPRLGLAEALQDAGRCDAAIPHYQTGIALRPQEPFGYSKLGACFIEVGRLDDADATFSRLEELDPRSPLPAIGRGMTALARGRNAEAAQNLRTALDRDQANVAARRLLAAAVQDDNPDEARQLCDEVRQLAPGSPAAASCVAAVTREINRP